MIRAWLRARLRAWLGVPEDVVVLVVPHVPLNEAEIGLLARAAAKDKGEVN